MEANGRECDNKDARVSSDEAEDAGAEPQPIMIEELQDSEGDSDSDPGDANGRREESNSAIMIEELKDSEGDSDSDPGDANGRREESNSAEPPPDTAETMRTEDTRNQGTDAPKKSALKRTPSGMRDPAIQRTQSAARFVEEHSQGEISDRPPSRGSSSAGSLRDASHEKGSQLGKALSRASSSATRASFRPGKQEATINHARFEKKKRRIAARLRTQQEIDRFRKETGPTLGGQWVDQKWVARSVLLEQEDEKDKFHAKQWLKEVGLYVVFVFAFTWVIYAGRNNEAFIGYKQFWRNTVDKHMVDIRTPETVLEAVEALFLEDFVDRDNFTVDSYTTKAAHGYLHGSILIGEVRMRQLRVKEGECSRTYAKLANFGLAPSTKCYPAWILGEEEQEYSKENGTVLAHWQSFPFYSYTSSAGASDPGFVGKFGSYHGGGFAANFSATTARSTLANLQELHWVDVKTRAIVLNFAFFNVDLDMFASYRGAFEFVGSGVVAVSSDMDVVSLVRYPVLGIMDIVRVGMLGFVYMMVVYYVFEDLDHCRKHGVAKYRSFGWAYVDAVNICLFVLSGLFKVSNLILFELAMPADISDVAMLRRVQDLGYSLYLEDQVNGLNGFLLWIKMLRFVPITRRLLRLSTVLAASLADIATYAFLFAVLLYAFAVLGYLLFGNHLAGFITVSDACLALLRTMYGDVDFAELEAAAGGTGLVYAFAWLILSNVVLLNMVIAILSEDYRRVQREETDNPTPSVQPRPHSGFEEANRSRHDKVYRLRVA